MNRRLFLPQELKTGLTEPKLLNGEAGQAAMDTAVKPGNNGWHWRAVYF